MADTNKKRFYFVDPGIGEKGEFCPYSAFEDGHDVQMYITPPEGYELSGFKLEPYDSPDHFYEGKIVAQFIKKEESFTEIAGPNFWKFIIAFVAVISIIAGIIIFFINRNNKQKEVIEYTAAEVVSTVDDSIKAILPEEAIAQETAAEPEAVVEQKAVKEEPVEEKIVKEEVVEEEKVKTPVKEIVKDEETPLPTDEITAQFKEEFWTLIHQQENKMSAYGKLFRTYKKKVKGEEYKYLGWTILKSNKDFEAWSNSLLRVPSDRISTVNNIDQLTKLLEEFNN